MSSPYGRADSPPPRQPSPDLLPAPLPYPPRRVSSQPKILLSPNGHARTKTLQTARSFDFSGTRSYTEDDRRSLRNARMPSRSTLSVSPLSTPRSSPAPSARSSPDSFVPRHRRTPSIVVSPSPSPSPTCTSHMQTPPPVPYRYSGPQHIISPKPVSFATTPIIIIPDIVDHSDPSFDDCQKTPIPSQSVSQMQFFKESSYQQDPVLPPLEKHKSMGMACLKFFGIKTTTTTLTTSNHRQPGSSVTAM